MQITSTELTVSREQAGKQLDTNELTKLLIKENKFKEGHYELSIEFMFSAGNIVESLDKTLPTAFVGISRIGLARVSSPTPISIDASSISRKNKPKA
jgi:S-adenosylmethionine hydrolase